MNRKSFKNSWRNFATILKSYYVKLEKHYSDLTITLHAVKITSPSWGKQYPIDWALFYKCWNPGFAAISEPRKPTGKFKGQIVFRRSV